MRYDIVFLSPLPSFYKVNLFNRISKSKSIFVIFFASGTSEHRSSDFVSLVNDITFPHVILSFSSLQERSIFRNLLSIVQLRFVFQTKVFMASGWKFAEDWLGILLFGYICRSSIVESSIHDSSKSFVRNLFKKFFLSRLNICLVPGCLNSRLLRNLNFKGEIIITSGVGLINKSIQGSISKSLQIASDSFVFVGRLVDEKNLISLIAAFNLNPKFKLFVIGDGPLYSTLKELSGSNIFFLGQQTNDFVHTALSHCGCLVLPSIYEPWGLVVEEALYRGKLCIVSDRCGISALSGSCANLLVCQPTTESINYYLSLAYTLLPVSSHMASNAHSFINSKDKDQLNSYLSLPSVV